jgi:hypothetical protein
MPPSHMYMDRNPPAQTDFLDVTMSVPYHGTVDLVGLDVPSFSERRFSFIRSLRALSPRTRHSSVTATTVNGIWSFVSETSKHPVVAGMCSAISSSRYQARSHDWEGPFDSTTFWTLLLQFLHGNGEKLLSLNSMLLDWDTCKLNQIVAKRYCIVLALRKHHTGKRASHVNPDYSQRSSLLHLVQRETVSRTTRAARTTMYASRSSPVSSPSRYCSLVCTGSF